MRAPLSILDPLAKDQIQLKIAKLNLMSKQAFVPSPSTQGQIQQQAQQSGQQPQQDPNSQAIGASGITLDEVAQMIDQFYQENTAQFGQVQQQIVAIQQQINAPTDGDGKPKEGKGGDSAALEARIAQLELMLGGGSGIAAASGPPTATPPPAAPPTDPNAAMAQAPVPGQPTAPPPAAQQGAPQQQMAPMPGA
jgi:hypothetical protein